MPVEQGTTPNMPTFRILIIGAGIAGTALALLLSRLPFPVIVIVIERHPFLRTSGLQLDLRGHGITVLQRMGLEAAFRSSAAPEQGLKIVDSKGRRWAWFGANKSGKGVQGFTSDFEIMRGDLCRMFCEKGTEAGVEFRFGLKVDRFEEDEQGRVVEVRFTDGTVDRFDLVVGADGQNSRTRRMMLPTTTKELANKDGHGHGHGHGDSDPTFYPLAGADQYIAYFTIPRSMQEGDGYFATTYVAPWRRAVMTRRHDPETMQVYLMCTTDSERLRKARKGYIAEEKAAFQEIFQGAGWITEDILKGMMEDSDDFYCERMGLVKLDSWSKGHVVLLGDAAYCPSANTGMGTTSAVVGAYILAGEIGRNCGGSRLVEGTGASASASDGQESCANDNLATALKSFERIFRPFMDQVQKGVLEDEGFSNKVVTPFSIFVMNCLMALASLLRINIIGRFVLKEEVTGWDLPEYEELSGSQVAASEAR